MPRKRMLWSMAVVVIIVGAQASSAFADGELATFPAGNSVVATGAQSGTNHRLTLTDHSVGGGGFWTFECTAVNLTGTTGFETGAKAITVHPIYEGCTIGGIAITFTTTNCNYVYHLGEETASGWLVTTDISCSEGSAITIVTGTCELKIESQTGLAGGEATNSGSASPETAMDLVIHQNVTNLKYTVLKDGLGCALSGTGTFGKGDYTGTTTMTAHDAVTASQVGLTVGESPPPPPPGLIATGEQVGRNSLQLTDHLISGKAATAECQSLSSAASEPVANLEETILIHPEYKECTAFGLKATIATTGCNYLFHINSPAGSGRHVTTDVSCSAGSSVKVIAGLCEVTIGSQVGLTTSEAVNSGTEEAMDLLLHTNINGIHYTVVKDGIGCPLSGTGSFSKGDYTGTTTLQAHDSVTKAAVDLTIKPPPSLIATGEQSGENTIQLTDHPISGEPASVKCKAMTLTGTEAVGAVEEELRVHPEYKECTAFGAAATVTTTNCDYLFHIGSATAGGWHATTDVACSGGSTIKIVSGNCEVTIKGETGLTTSELTNSGTEAEMDLLLHTSITGVHYTVVKDGTGCPLSGTGEFSQGDYTGTTTIKAHDSETLEPTDITKT